VPPPIKGPIPPPDPLADARIGGGPAPDFDYHTTGLAVDIARPSDVSNRKRLDYALGYLSDRDIVWWRDETNARKKQARYHVVPNPRYAAALRQIAASGVVPALPGL
jgi:hypothetical protein